MSATFHEAMRRAKTEHICPACGTKMTEPAKRRWSWVDWVTLVLLLNAVIAASVYAVEGQYDHASWFGITATFLLVADSSGLGHG